MRRGRRGRPAVLAVALCLLMLLAGCVSLPTAGPVQEAEPVPAYNADNTQVRVEATPPQPGAGPMDIARGFLEAMAAGRQGEPIAREYLSPARRTEWRPNTTIVYENPPGSGPDAPLSEPQHGRVILQADKLAEIAPDGTWEPAGDDEAITVHFGLVRVEDEWRIGRPPAGLLMLRDDVEREYEQLNRYFFTPDFEALVPDPVFVPVRGTRETLLVQSLLLGPSSWLRPAVRTAIPDGMDPSTLSVVVEGDLATIELDESVLELSDNQRQLLLAQLAWTLKEAQVGRIRVTVDQAPLPVSSQEGPEHDVDSWAGYDPNRPVDPQPFAVSGGRFVAVDEARADPVPIDGPLGSGETPVEMAVPNLPENQVAAITQDGTRLVRGDLRLPDDGPANEDIQPEEVARGKELLTPSWDRFDRLWVVDRADGVASISVVLPDGEIQDVEAPDLEGTDLRALRVARDGVRVAAVVERQSGSKVLVGRVHDGTELVIDGVRELPMPRPLYAADLAWSDIDELVVLGESEDEQPQPLLLSVDGSTTAGVGSTPSGRVADSPPSAVSVAATPSAPLMVATADNWVWLQHPARGWIRRGQGHSPAYAG